MTLRDMAARGICKEMLKPHFRLPLAYCNGLSFSFSYTMVFVLNDLPTQAVTATTLLILKKMYFTSISLAIS